MLISFREAPLDLLTQVWLKMFPARYAVDERQLRINTIECPVFDWGASSISVFDDQILGFLAMKRSANPLLYKGPSYDQAHLSAIAFIEPAIGVDMMSYAKETLRLRGIDRIVFGQDSRHFFPGCPDDCPKLKDFLVVEGFSEIGEAVDLECDLADYMPPLDVGKTLLAANASIRPVCSDSLPNFAEFLKREFPGRWAYDATTKIQGEERPGFVNALFVNDKIEGFAITQDASHKFPVAGACWRHDLGENWGTLGPIGVSKSVRGKGLGDAVLASSLLKLQASGVRRCLIDWTTLVDWYGKHGFIPTRTYKTMALQLEAR